VSYQNPYILQQLPFGQFPQTVLPFAAPQVPEFQRISIASNKARIELYLVPASWGTTLRQSEDSPSVVAAPVAATEAGIVADIPPITGSPVVVGCALPPAFPPEPAVHPL
jgi:hypothetical protein